MKKIIFITFFILIVFSSFPVDSSNDDASTFNKAFNFTVGVDLSASGEYGNSIYTDYYLDLYYDAFGDRLDRINRYVDFDAISIGLPISFLFFINPQFALGFSLNISILHINISKYINNSPFAEDNYALSFTNSFKILFKMKAGKKNSKIKFISEIGPDISIDLWGLMGQDEADGIERYTIMAGPFLFLGFEFSNNSFSLETGGFIEGLFGSIYDKEIEIDPSGRINKYYERTSNHYILKFGASIRIGYSYLKKLN